VLFAVDPMQILTAENAKNAETGDRLGSYLGSVSALLVLFAVDPMQILTAESAKIAETRD